MECIVIEHEANLLQFTENQEGKGGKVVKENENITNCYLYYLDRAAYLMLTIFTSCKADEVSQDAGEGKGSTWTNTFIAKGIMNPSPGY